MREMQGVGSPYQTPTQKPEPERNMKYRVVFSPDGDTPPAEVTVDGIVEVFEAGHGFAFLNSKGEAECLVSYDRFIMASKLEGA